LRFDHLTVEDGLSNTWIRAILKDSRGFLWFGTQGGLNRYDGRRFIPYRHDPEDEHSLLVSTATALFEDSKDRLWVGADVLHLYDRERDRFDRVPLDPESTTSNQQPVRAIREGRDGVLWVATENGLYQYDPESGALHRFEFDAGNRNSLSASSVRALLVDQRSRLWVGTARGLDRYDAQRERFARVLPRAGGPQGLSALDVETIAEEDDGTLWVGTIGQGLLRFDPGTGAVKQYLPDSRNPTSLSSPRVLSLLAAGNGTLYVGVENGGLDVLDTTTEEFTHHLPDPEDSGSLGSISIWSLMQDDQGILWIGTFNAGVDFSSPLGQRFGLIKASRDGLSDPHVTAVIEDHRGDLWIGTDGGGLNRLDRRTGRFTHFRHDPGNPNSLGSNAVLSLCEDDQHGIWIAMWAGGLQRLDPGTGRFYSYRRIDGDAGSLPDVNVRFVRQDSQGQILIGTQDQGARILDPATGRFGPLMRRDSGMTTTGTVSVITEDSQGNLWLSVPAGAYRVNRRTGRATAYEPDPEDPAAIVGGGVNSIFVDGRGQVWIGSAAGLSVIDPNGRVVRHYGAADGLPSDSIADVLEDAAGNVWVSTMRGLARMEDGVSLPEKPNVMRFDVHDGLQGYEFKSGAAFRSPSGEMFFGGQRGLNTFQPEEIEPNPHVPPVVLTGFRIFNQPPLIGAPGSPLTKAISEMKEMKVS
jgi:ligand-binding sensor domain-containing protein